MVYVPNKNSALVQVAEATAAWLRSSMIDEVTSYNEDALTDAEIERLQWAIAEVQRRLYLMGKRS